MSVKKFNNKNYNRSLRLDFILIYVVDVKYISINGIFDFLVFSVGKK